MSATLPPLYLKAVEYELGEEARPIDSLDAIPDDIMEQLRAGGLREFRGSPLTPVELARGPLERTLAALDDAERERITRVIFATNSFHDATIAGPQAVSGLLIDVGLPDAAPVGMFLSFCANLHSAIEVARGMLALDGDGSVLIICSDARADDGERLVAPNISVLSDAAATFVVTPDGGPYRILDSRFRVDSKLGVMDRSAQFLEFMDGVSQGVTGVLGGMLETLAIEPGDIKRLITPNHTVWVVRAMAELAGFQEERLYLDNIPRVAHAFAADNLINLCDYVDVGETEPGDLISLMGSGGFQWGCTTVEVC